MDTDSKIHMDIIYTIQGQLTKLGIYMQLLHNVVGVYLNSRIPRLPIALCLSLSLGSELVVVLLEYIVAKCPLEATLFICS